MRYLDKLLGEANNFKLLKTLVKRGRDAEAAGDKLDNKYLSKNTKTGRFASDDRKQNKRLVRLGNTERERSKAFTQADMLVPKVKLKGGGKGDGKPKGKLRLVQSAFYQQVGSIIVEFSRIKSDDDKQKARDKVTAAGKKIQMATNAYKTAKSDVGSKKRGSASRKRAAKYLKDGLDARRTVRKNVKRALQPKTEET